MGFKEVEGIDTEAVLDVLPYSPLTPADRDILGNSLEPTSVSEIAVETSRSPEYGGRDVRRLESQGILEEKEGGYKVNWRFLDNSY